ncbi:hypothetical protein GGR45_003577 [Sphingomonas zeae]|jgi:hypothetical protein|nr:hypothetical protein [Sphingomonas zeae]
MRSMVEGERHTGRPMGKTPSTALRAVPSRTGEDYLACKNPSITIQR